MRLSGFILLFLVASFLVGCKKCAECKLTTTAEANSQIVATNTENLGELCGDDLEAIEKTGPQVNYSSFVNETTKTTTEYTCE